MFQNLANGEPLQLNSRDSGSPASLGSRSRRVLTVLPALPSCSVSVSFSLADRVKEG